MNYSNIKTDVIESLNRYVEHGVPTGDFLRAVLANDLMEALGRADMQNREAIYDICMYVYNEMPSTCHGSREIVDAWITRFADERKQPSVAEVVGG